MMLVIGSALPVLADFPATLQSFAPDLYWRLALCTSSTNYIKCCNNKPDPILDSSWYKRFCNHILHCSGNN